MIIVSGANATFKDRVEFSMKQATKFGYDMKVYDMGGLGFGKKYELPRGFSSLALSHRSKLLMMKPRIMLDALDSTDETVVFLDADAFLVRPIDEIETDDYDVGVTYKGGERNTYINTGVLFLKQNVNARDLLYQWIDLIEDANAKLKTVNPNRLGDQIFLNDLVFSYVQKGKLLNTVQRVDGIRVKFFDYHEYNNFNLARDRGKKLKPLPSNTRIVHLRHAHADTLQEVIARWRM
jgi:hypothetical protein